MADTIGGTPHYGIELRASGLWIVYDTRNGTVVYQSIVREDAYTQMTKLNTTTGSTGVWVCES